MRKLLFGAAVAALTAAPGLAHADNNAVVGIDYNNVDFPGSTPTAKVYGLSGAFNHDFSNAWEVQVDGYAGRADISGCCLNTSYAAVHLGTRSSSYSFAGFLGEQSLGPFSGLNGGAEGQMFFSQAMIEGTVGYSDYSDVHGHVTNAQVDGAWYINPDFSLNAVVGYDDINFGSSSHWWSYGVSGEYRFANSPASLSLGYRQSDFSGSHVDTWSIGLTFDLGTGSLQDRASKGPSWNGARSTYDNFGRTIGLVF